MQPTAREIPSFHEKFFSHQLITWQKGHGRHDLPWQNTRDPYKIWLSEVMLQQTQVTTALPYFQRFIENYPTVERLSTADLEDVLRLWSGLGYYSRARNLLAAAKIVEDRYGGKFPSSYASLIELPGVGDSTAAAIAAFSSGERVSIFDGNVQRVFSRYLGYSEDLSASRNRRLLKEQVDRYLPPPPASIEDMTAYTQGLMDLGSSVCAPKTPNCRACPVVENCKGYRSGLPAQYPVKTKKPLRKQKIWYMWVFKNPDGQMWLEKRPVKGIWPSLFSFPTTEIPSAPFGKHHAEIREGGPIRHSLTHMDIAIFYAVVPIDAPTACQVSASSVDGCWVDFQAALNFGIPQPVKKIIHALLLQCDVKSLDA